MVFRGHHTPDGLLHFCVDDLVCALGAIGGLDCNHDDGRLDSKSIDDRHIPDGLLHLYVDVEDIDDPD